MVTSRRGLSGIERGKGIFDQWKAKGRCSSGDRCSFRHESHDRAKPTPKASPSSDPPTPRGRSASTKRSLRRRSPSGKSNRQPCRDVLKGTCTKSPCDYWHPPKCQFCKSETGCKFGTECSCPHLKFEEQPNKGPKKGANKSAVAIVKSVRQLSCVSQDAEPPESAAISWKGTRVLKSIRRVRFSQASIRENKGPSLNKIQIKNPHQRGPYAVKFEDRSQGATERQARCARGDAWRLAKHIYKLKEKDKSYVLFAFR